MEELLKDYKRRLKAVKEALEDTNRIAYPIAHARLQTKMDCYRNVIIDLERELKNN